jgi:hypothetical protein
MGADGTYAGPLVEEVKGLRSRRPIRLEITMHFDAVHGFVVILKR